MLDIRADTEGVTAFIPMMDKDGREFLVVLLKHTFTTDAAGNVTRAEKQSPIDFADTYNGDDAASASIRRPSQVFDYKPGTDVILLGHAHPPPNREARHVDVTLKMGPIAKTLRAHGLRVWQKSGLGGLAPGPALPIREPIPLIYELAWGGQDMSRPEKPVGEPRNYSGRGVSSDTSKLVDRPASQLDHPDYPAGSRNPVPVSFGPIHRHWQPRVSFAGSYDERWQLSRMPLLPEDFDHRFHVCVPEDQWASTPLRGDEPVSIGGATPEGVWGFQLPRISPGFSSIVQGSMQQHRTHLDTILIDADTRIVELTWRAAIPCPPKLEMIDDILVVEKQLL